MTRVERKFLSLPWGFRICLGAASLIGIGVMFLTTIEKSFKISLYAGIGAFSIAFAASMLLWSAAREM